MTEICGIDEAGRGPLAGPVVAAAVILTDDFPTERLRDSKQIREAERYEVEAIIRGKAARWGVSCAWPDEIDALNIHYATLLAMQRAFDIMMGRLVKNLANLDNSDTVSDGEAPNAADAPRRSELTESGGRLGATSRGENQREPIAPRRVLVDGRFVPDLDRPAEAVIGGDGSISAIQAASILAKTARDRWMISYAQRVPGYGFERHKGYPTPAHRSALSELGPSPIHRLSFRRVSSASS